MSEHPAQTPAAQAFVAKFHPDVLEQVRSTVASQAVVVVGMAQNPVVKKARKALDAAQIQYTYLEYGSYMSKWRERLVIKMWSGWPLFPQVFVQGALVGGCDETLTALEDGSFTAMLEKGRAERSEP